MKPTYTAQGADIIVIDGDHADESAEEDLVDRIFSEFCLGK